MKILYYLIFMSLFTVFTGGQLYARSNFVTIDIANGVTVDLPVNWTVLSKNQRITLDAWRESLLESKNLTQIENNLPFAANYYDDYNEVVGTFSIMFYPNNKISLIDVVSAGPESIKLIDKGIKNNYQVGLEAAGGQLLKWLGTEKRFINSNVYLVSEAKQINAQNKKFFLKLVRYLNQKHSFTIIISYRDDQSFYLEPICDKITNSIRR